MTVVLFLSSILEIMKQFRVACRTLCTAHRKMIKLKHYQESSGSRFFALSKDCETHALVFIKMSSLCDI